MRSPRSLLVAACLLCCALLVTAAAGAATHHGGDRSHKRHHAPTRKPRLHRAQKVEPGAPGTGTIGVGKGTSVESGSPSRPSGSTGSTKSTGTTKSTAPTPTPTPPVPVPVPPPAPPAAEGKVLYKGLFDGTFSPWYVQSLASRASLDTAHPYEGSAAGRFEVRPGDVEPDTGSQRSEVTGPTFHEGEEIYVRDDIRVPVGYTFQGNWQLIDQLHETPWSGSPGIATFLDPNRFISFGAGDGSPMYWRGPQLEQERWYDLVYRVNLERDATQGFVEVWFNGIQQTLLNGQTRMYGETIQTAETYLKAGIYRSLSSTGVSIVEHDNIVVGTSLAAAMAQ